jgi:hypothetical protein
MANPQDKIVILTGVSRSKGDSAVFLLDQDTSECLHYEPITGYPPRNIAKIPRGILEGHPNVDIRYDLIDCSIDVCAVEASQPPFLCHKLLIRYSCRCPHYSKITLITVILGGTLYTAYLLRIYS